MNINTFGIIIAAIGFLLIWVMTGFIGFLIEAKDRCIVTFNVEVQDEFRLCILLGPFALIILLGNFLFRFTHKKIFCDLQNKFASFMEKILWKINKK